MGQLHNELRRGQLSNAVSAAVGDTRGGGVERYGETLTPTLNIWGLPEWAYLRREVLVGDARTVAAGAATEFSSYAIINPAGSNMLVVLLGLVSSIPATATVRVGLSTEATLNANLATAIGGGSFLDTRWSARVAAGTGQARIRTGVFAGEIGVPISRLDQLTGTSSEVLAGRNIVLSPGFGAVIQNLDDAALLHATAAWRERQAFPSELD